MDAMHDGSEVGRQRLERKGHEQGICTMWRSRLQDVSRGGMTKITRRVIRKVERGWREICTNQDLRTCFGIAPFDNKVERIRSLSSSIKLNSNKIEGRRRSLHPVRSIGDLPWDTFFQWGCVGRSTVFVKPFLLCSRVQFTSVASRFYICSAPMNVKSENGFICTNGEHTVVERDTFCTVDVI